MVETDFGLSRPDILQSLRRVRYDVIIVTDLPDAPVARVLDWIRAAGWRTPVILIGEGLTRDADTIAVLTSQEATTETLEAHFREIPRSSEVGGDWPPGNVQELITLTRDSVAAQTHTAAGVESMRREIAELRASIREDMRDLGSKVDEMRTYADKQRDTILSKIGEGPWSKVSDGLKWIVDHPFIAIAVFCAILVLLASLVVGINALQPGKVEMLRDWSGHGAPKPAH